MKGISYSASGTGTSGIQSMTISAGSTARAGGVRKVSQRKTAKKKLNYNPREIRSALMRASKAQSAGRVLCQAKSKLSVLLKCKGTGQYDEAELTNAIIHARRMVQCAQMKTRNLKQEEQQQKRYAKEVQAEEQSRKNDIKLRVKQKERNLEQKENIEKIQKVQKYRRHNQELMRKRRMHRNMERGKMDEADLEYKRNMDRDSRNSAGMTGYEFIPLEGVELELSDDGLKLTEEQIEQQIEMMAEAEISIGTVMPEVTGGMEMAAAGGGVFNGGEGAVVDLTVG